jgi:hypothetical protein
MDLRDSLRLASTAPSDRRPMTSGRGTGWVLAGTAVDPSPPSARSNGAAPRAAPRSMRVAVVSTYPPRACGIGTFSQDLRVALLGTDGVSAVDVVAIVREDDIDEPAEVIARIHQDKRGDYAAAARVLEREGHDIVVIQHEYGIFGGHEGGHVLTLAEDLRQPIVLTLHTVLSAPSVGQAETLRALCDRAALVCVFTETARRLILDARLASPERVRVVPHGGPTQLLPNTNGDRRPARAAYVIAGQTHPEVAKRDGEEYRISLERLTRDLDLGDHVVFDDRFLSIDDLSSMLAATTIHLTPYRSREQIVSGALTFATVAGCPTVSTPYFYAEDLLASGAGALVPFDDPPALAAAVNRLLDDPARLQRARTEARRVGAGLAWPDVGRQTADVLREAVALGPPRTTRRLPPATFPRARGSHLATLVDDVGIVQHAEGIAPLLSSGYCTDDVARLAIVAVGLGRRTGGEAHHRMLALSLGFLRRAWSADVGGMHNLMSHDRRWLDRPHGGDHLGRAAWALGEVVGAGAVLAPGAPGLTLLREMLPALAEQRSPRTMAFAALGLAHADPELVGPGAIEVLRVLAGRLASQLRANASRDWYWAEDILAYDNARLPQALIASARRLGNDEMLREGMRSLDWYGREVRIDGPCVHLVGHHGRRRDEPRPGNGDEQPLDAAALVEAEVEAFLATRDDARARHAVRAFEWFLGRNRLEQPVYDRFTGGCHDGLGESAVNRNEGAESTLAYLQALLALDAAGLRPTLPG